MKKKVLIVYNFILHYRIPFFEFLSEKYDLTVIHSGKKSLNENESLKEIISPLIKIGPFHYQKDLLKEIKKDYDIIIYLFDLAWISSVITFLFFNKNKKNILWGAWFTKNVYANRLRLYFSRIADANIFYTNQSRGEFESKNKKLHSKSYVANNTVYLKDRFESYKFQDKFRILFVGSLDERKRIDITLDAFKNVINKIDERIVFTIIGSGIKLNELKEKVNELNLSKRVVFVGRINDSSKLTPYYQESLFNLSYGQAGLSVLQSLGNGVPFMTHYKAISGGEITNLKHNYNSILVKSENELEFFIEDLCNNSKECKRLGKNAYNYYSEFCTMDNMVQGFVDAIENTRKSNIDLNNFHE